MWRWRCRCRPGSCLSNEALWYRHPIIPGLAHANTEPRTSPPSPKTRPRQGLNEDQMTLTPAQLDGPNPDCPLPNPKFVSLFVPDREDDISGSRPLTTGWGWALYNSAWGDGWDRACFQTRTPSPAKETVRILIGVGKATLSLSGPTVRVRHFSTTKPSPAKETVGVPRHSL